MKFKDIYFCEDESLDVNDRAEYKGKWYSVVSIDDDKVTLRDTSKTRDGEFVVDKSDLSTSATSIPGIDKHSTDYTKRKLRSDAGKKRKTKEQKAKEKAEEPEQLSLF